MIFCYGNPSWLRHSTHKIFPEFDYFSSPPLLPYRGPSHYHLLLGLLQEPPNWSLHFYPSPSKVLSQLAVKMILQNVLINQMMSLLCSKLCDGSPFLSELMDYMALYRLTPIPSWYLFDLILLPLCLFYSLLTYLFAVPQICQICSQLRAFVLVIPSAWNSLPPENLMAHPSSSLSFCDNANSSLRPTFTMLFRISICCPFLALLFLLFLLDYSFRHYDFLTHCLFY